MKQVYQMKNSQTILDTDIIVYKKYRPMYGCYAYLIESLYGFTLDHYIKSLNETYPSDFLISHYYLVNIDLVIDYKQILRNSKIESILNDK